MGLVTTEPLFLFHANEGGGGAALGTGGESGDPAAASAGTENADNGGSGPPETVPYARFKEVNDRLAGYRELEQIGYDPDSLGRLVQFEAALVQDPADALERLVDNLDLPDHVKDGVKAQIAAQDPNPDGGAGRREPEAGEPGADEPPAWAKPLIERDREQREREEREQAEAAERRREETLKAVMDEWRTADEADGIKTPEATMLAYIAANARQGVSVEQLAQAARADRMEAREADLQGAVAKVGNTSGSPLPVSGGAPPPPEGTDLKDIKSATAAARAAIEAGTLPGIGG